MKHLAPLILIVLGFSFCSNPVNKADLSTVNKKESVQYSLARFLQSELAEDTAFIQKDQKRFAIDSADINGDKHKELFIYLKSSYFCGSGGCTFYILSPSFEKLARFSVTRTPVFIEPKVINDWSLILLYSSGYYREMVYEDGSYPENPSVLPAAPYDAPSGHAQVLFDERASDLKLYTF